MCFDSILNKVFVHVDIHGITVLGNVLLELFFFCSSKIFASNILGTVITRMETYTNTKAHTENYEFPKKFVGNSHRYICVKCSQAMRNRGMGGGYGGGGGGGILVDKKSPSGNLSESCPSFCTYGHCGPDPCHMNCIDLTLRRCCRQTYPDFGCCRQCPTSDFCPRVVCSRSYCDPSGYCGISGQCYPCDRFHPSCSGW